MLKFIWNSWWRNKERFILLLVGVLIVSTGLSYLIGRRRQQRHRRRRAAKTLGFILRHRRPAARTAAV